MTWFKDRWSLFWEAYSRQKWVFTIALLVCVAVGTGDYLTKFISRWITFPSKGSMEILGVPAPLLGIVLFFIVLFWVMLDAAVEFNKALAPTIAVSFNPKAEGIVKTRTEIYHGGAKIRDDVATYIRITLISRSQKTVKGCAVFLTKLEKRISPADHFIDIPLQGALSLTQSPIDVYPRIPATVDFLKAGQFDKRLKGTIPWPFRLDDVLNDNATYRFTIEVVGDDIAKNICVEIDWGGKWDGITGRECVAAPVISPRRMQTIKVVRMHKL